MSHYARMHVKPIHISMGHEMDQGKRQFEILQHVGLSSTCLQNLQQNITPMKKFNLFLGFVDMLV